MNFHFDTDHISILQQLTGPEFAAIMARIALHSPADLAFCVVSFHEQMLGVHTYINRARTSADRVRGYDMMGRLIAGYSAAVVLPFDGSASAVWDRLIAQKVRIGRMDMRIAAIALSTGLVVLTRNVRDFSQVPGLVTDDWTI